MHKDAQVQVLCDNSFDVPPVLSIIVGNWGRLTADEIQLCLSLQTGPRAAFEVVWIEERDCGGPEIQPDPEPCSGQGLPPIADRVIAVTLPSGVETHRHLMYNLGLLSSRGRFVVIGEFDSVHDRSFVSSVVSALESEPDGVLRLGPSFIAVAREDLIRLGGADEHVDYLGDLGGVEELVRRLVNAGRRERWWTGAGQDIACDVAPDGQVAAPVAVVGRTGRLMPLVENEAVRRLRECGANDPLAPTLAMAVSGERLEDWLVADRARPRRDAPAEPASLAMRPHRSEVALQSVDFANHVFRATLLARLAWAHYDGENYAEALMKFDEALQHNPQDWAAHCGRGWALVQLQNPDAALPDFDGVIAEGDVPGDHVLQKALRGRGWAHLKLDRLASAVVDFSAAIEKMSADDPKAYQDALRGRARAYFRLGRWKHARRDAAAQAGRLSIGYTRLAMDAYGSLLKYRVRRMVRITR